MKKLKLPVEYTSKLDKLETQKAIHACKTFFETSLSESLDLTKFTSPLFVDPTSGIQDDLDGKDQPVSFDGRDGASMQIVHSLAKRKRLVLHKYKIASGSGIYAHMLAVRKDEVLGSFHSYLVDQRDWEKIISKEDRTFDYLISIVEKIYDTIKLTEEFLFEKYPSLSKKLPEDIFVITTQALEDLYPEKSPKEREDIVAKKYGAVFIAKIGGLLESGERHDDRAPDYDDRSLDGDIVLWHPSLECAFEISSMGIRVDKETLKTQLKRVDAEHKLALPFHKMLLDDILPLTMGGGIGQSRLLMFLLEKVHIGEIQPSIWPKAMKFACSQKGIELLS